MTKDEALKQIREWDFLNDEERAALETLIPELTESEDERIRKWLYDYIERVGKTWGKPGPFDYTQILAYLERQKEPEDDEGDFTIYHPQKNGEGNYECIPFSFYGSLTAFSNDKDLMDFLNESFYDKEECEIWCEVENKPKLPECKHKVKKDSVFDYLCDNEKQKEQKPAEWSEEDEEMLEYIIGDVNDAKQLYTTQAAKDMADKEIVWLKSLRPQPKQEWDDDDYICFSEIVSLIRQHYRGENIERGNELINWFEDYEPVYIGHKTEKAFIAGAEWQREQMLKDAVEGEAEELYNDGESQCTVSVGTYFKPGDKVYVLKAEED